MGRTLARDPPGRHTAAGRVPRPRRMPRLRPLMTRTVVTSRRARSPRGTLALIPALALALALAGCAPAHAPAGSRFTWAVGQGSPAFDPQGPPDAVRWALERMRSRGLVERDSTGTIVPMAAERWDVSPDSLRWTFHLRAGLVFSDGAPCTSGDLASALIAGFQRRDHSTTRWLLGALAGLERARPGRPLPPLGIATPDPRTLELRLTRPDPRLLEILALPGVAVPWHGAPGADGWPAGLGPDRAGASAEARRTLVPVRGAAWLTGPPGTIADTLQVRFAVGAARMHSLLRHAVPDLAWPLPPGLFDLPEPAGYRLVGREASPPRRLELVMRADLPPTSKPAARHALAHGLNRTDLLDRLRGHAGAAPAWLVGGTPFTYPARSAEEVRGWLERGDLGRSMHVGMTYSADGVGGEVARGMQNEWARLGLDVELQPVRATAFGAHALDPVGAHLVLVEEQALLDDPAAELAGYVLPMRDPPVGAFRTNWRTREFDPWIAPGPPRTRMDLTSVERRLGEEDIVLPLSGLRWLWFQRNPGPDAPFHPRYGPAGVEPRTSGGGNGLRSSR